MADPLRPSGPQIPGSLMGEIQSEVAVEATPLLSFVLRNSRIIVTCIVLLVLVIAGVGGWQWHQTRVEREAHLELGRILVSTQGPERIAALETFLPAAPSAMKSGVQLEIATTALGLEQYGKAADAYAAVAAADPKGSIGMMAAINQADLLQRQGKYAEALAVFDSLEKSAPPFWKGRPCPPNSRASSTAHSPPTKASPPLWGMPRTTAISRPRSPN